MELLHLVCYYCAIIMVHAAIGYQCNNVAVTDIVHAWLTMIMIVCMTGLYKLT